MPPTATSTASNKRQRTQAASRKVPSVDDEDAEGEEDVEGDPGSSEFGESVNDEQVYCSCRKVSYGEVCRCLRFIIPNLILTTQPADGRLRQCCVSI